MGCLLVLSGLLSTAQAGTVKVYAAASLTNAMTDIAHIYQTHYPTTNIVPVFGASSALAKQVEAGASSDLFFSADQDWVNYLVQKKVIHSNALKPLLFNLNWFESLKGRIVGTDDVRSALAFVERGECQVGIVYKTDALISRKVKIIGIFPANSHSPIVYPLALTKQGQKNKEAVQFEKFIKSSKQAKAIFQKYGFSVKS